MSLIDWLIDWLTDWLIVSPVKYRPVKLTVCWYVWIRSLRICEYLILIDVKFMRSTLVRNIQSSQPMPITPCDVGTRNPRRDIGMLPRPRLQPTQWYFNHVPPRVLTRGNSFRPTAHPDQGETPTRLDWGVSIRSADHTRHKSWPMGIFGAPLCT